MTFINRKPPVVFALFLFFGLAIYAQTLGCGASARETALRSSFIGVNAAREGFVTWDEQHQGQIVAGATSYVDGQTQLAEYRTAREQIVSAFVVAYRAVALAATTEDAPLKDMLAAVKALREAIASLQEPPAASPGATVPATDGASAPSPSEVRRIDPPQPPAPPTL